MHPAQPRNRRTALRALAGATALALACTAAAHAAGATRTTQALKPGPACGGPLWRLMTFSDADRARVKLDRRPSSISDIAKLAPPHPIGLRQSTDFQRHSWRIQVVVDRYRIASNGEIVLVLYSIASGQYMNAYLENPHCLSAKTRDRAAIVAARQAFTSHCAPPAGAWKLLGTSVDLTGVGFWNPSHATRGALPNGAELRPVTDLRIVSGCGVATP